MHNSDWTEAMKSGLTAQEVGERLRNTSDGVDQSKRILAFYLCEMRDRHLYNDTGHRDAAHFAETQLDMDGRRYRELVDAGQKLAGLRRVDRAFCAGRISWSRVLLLFRVIDTHTEHAWIAFAIRSTYRDLKDEVANCDRGDLPGEGGQFGLKPRMRQLRMQVSEKTELLLDHLRKVMTEDESAITDDELLRDLAEIAMKHLDCEFPPPPPEPRRDSAADRNDDPIPLATRNAVLHRDHHCCRNCATRYDVEVHHIRDRASGGTNDSYNLISLCNACHANIHNDRLLLEGPDANKPVFFTSSDGTPIHRRRGGGIPPLTCGHVSSREGAEPPPVGLRDRAGSRAAKNRVAKKWSLAVPSNRSLSGLRVSCQGLDVPGHGRTSPILTNHKRVEITR